MTPCRKILHTLVIRRQLVHTGLGQTYWKSPEAAWPHEPSLDDITNQTKGTCMGGGSWAQQYPKKMCISKYCCIPSCLEEPSSLPEGSEDSNTIPDKCGAFTSPHTHPHETNTPVTQEPKPQLERAKPSETPRRTESDACGQLFLKTIWTRVPQAYDLFA